MRALRSATRAAVAREHLAGAPGRDAGERHLESPVVTSREKPSDRLRGSSLLPARSRTLAIVAVAVLLTIAVGGIVVSVWRARSQGGDAVATEAQAASPASRPRPKHHPGDPYHIVFAGNSDQLSPDAVDQISEMAESAKSSTAAIVLSGKVETTADRAARMALVKKRIYAVTRALISNGIEPGRLRVEVAEYPVGRIRPEEADVVQLDVR